jgi:stearoyl-CoA desaturase (delta-9 desaturase)
MLEAHRSRRVALYESRPMGEDVHLINVFYFSAIHLLPLGAFFSGVTRSSVIACVVLYFVRIFFITAGYHCYFSHRAFQAGRVIQFVLALGAQSSGQGSALKWAAAHRHHHANAGSPTDLHAPEQCGFWYSHMGWLLNRRYERVVSSRPKYLTKFPELVWLDRYFYLPLIVLAVSAGVLLGWPGLFVSFGLSTVLTFHATFCVNSLCHMFGTRRYDVSDDSRNNWFVALVMLGGGWHNNHHRCPRSARQGVLWWEIDVTYYVLRALACFHVIGNIYEPAARMKYANGGSVAGHVEPLRPKIIFATQPKSPRGRV